MFFYRPEKDGVLNSFWFVQNARKFATVCWVRRRGLKFRQPGGAWWSANVVVGGLRLGFVAVFVSGCVGALKLSAVRGLEDVAADAGWGVERTAGCEQRRR